MGAGVLLAGILEVRIPPSRGDWETGPGLPCGYIHRKGFGSRRKMLHSRAVAVTWVPQSDRGRSHNHRPFVVDV